MDKPAIAPQTSASLLIRVRDSNDSTSWNTFVRIYGGIIRSYCRHWNLQPNDIDDVTQEVLSTVATSIKNFDYDPRKGRFRAWLGTVTANKIKRFLGRQAKRVDRQRLGISEEVELGDVYRDPDSHWIDLFSEQILAEACRIVRPEFEYRTWLCFEATWIGKQSPAVVAEGLGIQVHAVYVNKSRVVKRLETEIRNLAEDLGHKITE